MTAELRDADDEVKHLRGVSTISSVS